MRNGEMEREWSLGGSCAESTAQHSGQEVEDERRLWRNKEGMPDRKPRSMDMAVGGFMDFQLHNAPVYCSSSCWCPSQGMCTRERVLTWKKSFQENFYIPNNAVATRMPCVLCSGYWATAGLQYILCWGAAMAGCGYHELNEFEAFYNIICNANILA